MKRNLFHEYILDDSILDDNISKLNEKRQYNEDLNRNEENILSNSSSNFNDNKQKKKFKRYNIKELANMVEDIPIDISINTEKISKETKETSTQTSNLQLKDQTNELSFNIEQGSNDGVENTSDNRSEVSKEDSQAHSSQEDSQAHSEDSQADSSQEDSQAHSSQENSQAHSSQEDSQADSSQENSQAHSQEDSEEDSEETSATSSENEYLLDLRSMSMTSDNSNISNNYADTKIIAYGKSVIQKDGETLSNSEYFLDVDGNDANIKLNVDGSPVIYADFKVDDLFNSINSHNYNDFLTKINKARSVDDSETSENSNVYESESKSDKISNAESINSLGSTSITENKDNSQNDENDENIKLPNKFLTIEKLEPEPGDDESSEVIIHIDHDKKKINL